MEALISKAYNLGKRHHEGIFRNYHVPPVPYFNHPVRVADRFSRLNLAEPDRTIGTSACYVHDGLEDPDKHDRFLSFDELVAETNYAVADLVRELTNPSKGSKLPRAKRKEMDRAHIRHISDIAKLIKLIDRTDNLNDMGGAPRDFRELYLGESELLLEAIGTVNYPDYIILRQEYLEALARVRINLP